LVALRDRYRVAFGNDPDADRHGIVTPSAGLLNPNHYLAVAIHYLLTHRPRWPARAAVGKTLVSSSMIDRVVQRLGRGLYESPVTPQHKARLQQLSPQTLTAATLAGEPILATLTRAPANDAPLGGLKVVTASGWFAARPSGTENVYKIYAESFKDEGHLRAILTEAQAIVGGAL